MKKFRRYYGLAWVVLALALVGTLGSAAWVCAQGLDEPAVPSAAVAAHGQIAAPAAAAGGNAAAFYAIAVTMAVACVAAGYAVAHVGAAAIGVLSEKPELMGRVLIFVGLAEGIAIYGLIIAIMLMRKL